VASGAAALTPDPSIPAEAIVPPSVVDADSTPMQLAPGGSGGSAFDEAVSRLEVFNGYLGVFVAAFLVALVATPIMRRMAVMNGIVDRPGEARKIHREPIAYLGGVAVFLGLMGGVLFSYLALAVPGLIEFHPSRYLVEGEFHSPVPISVVLGMFVIMLVGLLDDVISISPRLKIGGQLFAAAALAADDVGVRVAQGVFGPIGREVLGNEQLLWTIALPDIAFLPETLPINLMYWIGTGVIAVFVLGACNASNLIDGLDGLLSGVTSICALGLLILALGMAVADDGKLDAARVVLCMALLGACLGFLPHNFNPANIFLGDCGSLLLGFSTIVIILSLGDTGKTPLVVAGMIIYAIPLIDTTLAIVRRKMTGRRISDPDDQHLHHMLKRAMGVKGAVFSLYGIGIAFAALGVLASFGRARITYTLAIVLAAFIGVTAIKIAHRNQARRAPTSGPPSAPPRRAQREPEPLAVGDPSDSL